MIEISLIYFQIWTTITIHFTGNISIVEQKKSDSKHQSSFRHLVKYFVHNTNEEIHSQIKPKFQQPIETSKHISKILPIYTSNFILQAKQV